jgi:hypothetical protein
MYETIKIKDMVYPLDFYLVISNIQDERSKNCLNLRQIVHDLGCRQEDREANDRPPFRTK